MPAASSPPSSHKPKLTILRLPEVMRRVGLSRPSIYAAMSRHEFPPSVALTARGVGWIEDEVDSWIESRVAESRSGNYSPASKMPMRLRERQRNGTVPAPVAPPEAHV